MKTCPVLVLVSLVLATGLVDRVSAQIPDHPVITEVFNNPSGPNDGPTGHTPTNADQEFIEIYIPTLANLSPSLNPDSLKLTFYEIEGDSGNSERGFVNQRYDLPIFDLDPSNAPTPGALPRPTSGIVVLGWVDYDLANPPTALAGTPGARIGLINGGITVSPSGVMFVAINGAQFLGTTNFPVPVAESRIDIPNENASGVMKNGSNAYLLVNRDDPGYASIDDRNVTPDAGTCANMLACIVSLQNCVDASVCIGNSFADLPGGTILGLSSLLDGIAGNDDTGFTESSQPFAAGGGVDLDDVLPLGGVFSVWVAQIAEASGGGYGRRFVDVLRTTEDTMAGNEDPAFDAVNLYRNVFRSGPFFPTPGQVVFTTSPPELSLSLSNRLSFDILANTTGRPALLCANTGGNFGIDVAVSPGSSSDPAVATFAPGASALGVLGQTNALPQIVVTVAAGAPNGSIVSAPITVNATNSQAGDPAVVNATQNSTTFATVLNPTKAVDPAGALIETTVFAAVQGFGADPLVTNEFLLSDLATYISANLGTRAGGTLGNLSILLDPATDLENIAIVDPLRSSFPATELTFINAAGAIGTDDLVTTVLTSAKVLGGSSAYAGSINAGLTGLKAIEFAIPETLTKNGTFSPSEFLFFANAGGLVNDTIRSGLNSVTTARTFELALIDTNVTSTGIEGGSADDFGIIVEAGQVLPGAAVVSGEFIFLSYTGGLEGEDIDSVDVPGVHATDAILLDLDNLQDVLGVKSITRLFLIDSGTGGTVNIMEAVSLNIAVSTCLISGTTYADGQINPANECEVCNVSADPNAWSPLTGIACNDGLFCTLTSSCNAGVCVGSGTPCAAGESCDEAGNTCVAGTCLIDGTTYNGGQINPANECEVCNVSADPNAWSPLTGISCNDGLFCTLTSSCDAGVCVGAGTPCMAGESCDEACDVCAILTSCPAVTTTVEAGRFFAVTPAPGPDPVAILVQRTLPSSTCIPKYVGADGRLQDTPLFQTPAQWATIHVGGLDVIPAAQYAVQADCNGTMSTCTSVRTFVWGDVNDTGVSDLDDILLMLAGFSDNFDFATPQALELIPCDTFFTNITIDLDDILGVLAAFSNADYGLVCPIPCN